MEMIALTVPGTAALALAVWTAMKNPKQQNGEWIFNLIRHCLR
jgi:hypothetical protein